MVTKIISGGQTGVDLGALEAAEELNLKFGGWCPPLSNGHWSDVSKKYGLRPTPDECSGLAPDIPRSQRTEWNCRDSDGTLIVMREDPLSAGTEFCLEMCQLYLKEYMIINLTKFNLPGVQKWLENNNIEILNVAGPSEESSPGIFERTKQMLIDVIK